MPSASFAKLTANKYLNLFSATKVPKIRKSHYRFEIRLFPHTGNHRRRRRLRVNLLFRYVNARAISINIIEFKHYNNTTQPIELIKRTRVRIQTCTNKQTVLTRKSFYIVVALRSRRYYYHFK